MSEQEDERGDFVRLLNQHDAIPAGTSGRIVGGILWPIPTYLVSFDGESVHVADVHSAELVLANDLRAPA
jgi:hypothetical protein